MWDLSSPAALAHERRIAGAVREVEPGLSEEAILAATEGAARNLRGLTYLDAQVAGVPGVLVASSEAKKVTHRLVANLLAAGAKNVALPRCALCREEAVLTNRLPEGGRICERCYRRRSRMARCSRCGRHRHVARLSGDGEPLCSSCWARDPEGWEECSLCGEVYRVNARTEDGGAICVRCYRAPTDVCGVCGEEARITSRKGGVAACSRCYEHPKRRCGGCGRTTRIYRRATGDAPDLCHACWWEPIAVCHRCGEEGMCNGIKKGEPLCLRCRLADRVDANLAGPDGEIPAALRGLRDAIVSVGNPRSGHTWIGRSPAVGVVKKLASGELELTHEALDELPETPSLVHLRDLLVSSGALPERDPYLARLERTVDEQAAVVEDREDAYLLKTYGTWRVLRRVRHRKSLGRDAFFTAENARDRVREAARFVRWLNARGKGISGCSQADVDAYLADGAKARSFVRDFVAWAVRQRVIAGGVSVPASRGRDEPTGRVDQDGRLRTARRLLGDESLDPADRVAGLLVVVYAQPVTRVAALKPEDVEAREGEVYLRLGKKEAVLMPEPLGSLLLELPRRRQVGVAGKLVEEDPEWLFPGRQAGRHLHPEYLRTRLKRLGIESRPVRNAALTQLAAEVPPAVLADTIGVSEGTAARWVRRAAGDWTNYAALRARDASTTTDGGTDL
jgi:hypothetical protein